MLYLTRKVNQAVVIGGCTRVTVSAIHRNRCAIGIDWLPASPVPPIGYDLVPGKPIEIARDIKVMLRSTRSGQVKLGFKAPRNIPVHRQEIHDRIMEADGDVYNATS